MQETTMRASTLGQSRAMVAPHAGESDTNLMLQQAKRYAQPAVDRAERVRRERLNGKGVEEFGIRQRSMEEMRALETGAMHMSGSLANMLQENAPPSVLQSDYGLGVHSERHLQATFQPAVIARNMRVQQAATTGNLKDMVRNMPNGQLSNDM
jgi:hypothetical protein